MTAFRSAIYRGQLDHCRLLPRFHQFRYQVFMMYLDLDEVEQVFALSRLWSAGGFAPAWLRRRDFLGGEQPDLVAPAQRKPGEQIKAAVAARIQQETGEPFTGRICMLANLRYFGFQMNPLVCYYCFDTQDRLHYIVAEVTNTPWQERFAYVLHCDPERAVQRIRFGKALHVSPFNSMDMFYDWRSNVPGSSLMLVLKNRRAAGAGEETLFNATLALQREEICARSLTRLVLGYPFMTVKVGAAIYWQALRLWLKGLRFVPHPGSR